ncbi:hypothetical protein E2542_SST09300 [Spatholobus suberectus]|nr:hypothetical protein E2542_SST09300 [Spatholobus suberectus]
MWRCENKHAVNGLDLFLPDPRFDSRLNVRNPFSVIRILIGNPDTKVQNIASLKSSEASTLDVRNPNKYRDGTRRLHSAFVLLQNIGHNLSIIGTLKANGVSEVVLGIN